MIIDYSMWRPTQRTELGDTAGVIRYLSHDPAKAMSAAEMEQLHSWGMPTGLVFEDAATRPTLGRTAGKSDGAFAADEAERLRVPEKRPIYVALDFDLQDYSPHSTSATMKLGPVGDYLNAFGDELIASGYFAGVYGGYWAVKRAIDAGLTQWGWQTISWSPVQSGIPQQDTRIRLYQSGVQVLRGNADLNLAANRDWGQFRRETRMLTRMLIGAEA